MRAGSSAACGWRAMTEEGFKLIDLHPPRANMRTEVLEGLSQRPKVIPSKYFYDARGSELFRMITRIPDYYLTRTENAIMEANFGEMANLVGPGAAVIEFGSGTGEKIRRLLRHLHQPRACVPVEISRDHLLQTAAGLVRDFPALDVVAVCADFTRDFDLPDTGSRRNLVFFPGSTIGNFEPGAALSLLRVMRHVAGNDGALLIGIDRIKDRQTLEHAYNDEAGITADFNLNLLKRFNRELSADFRLEEFEHRAVYNAAEERIEMYLDCLSDTRVHFGTATVTFERGESVLTEYSHKYEPGKFEQLANKAGFALSRIWSDAQDMFSVLYLESR
jgi:L-histidine N-alpha-methyltransferase